MDPRSRQCRAAQRKLFNDITLVITQLLTIVLPLFFQVSLLCQRTLSHIHPHWSWLGD